MTQDLFLLLDASLLLPILGFETSDRIMMAFQKLGSYELCYSEISILEALWKIVKTIKGVEEELSRIEEGITAIRETMRHVPINSEAVENVIHVYKPGTWLTTLTLSYHLTCFMCTYCSSLLNQRSRVWALAIALNDFFLIISS